MYDEASNNNPIVFIAFFLSETVDFPFIILCFDAAAFAGFGHYFGKLLFKFISSPSGGYTVSDGSHFDFRCINVSTHLKNDEVKNNCASYE